MIRRSGSSIGVALRLLATGLAAVAFVAPPLEAQAARRGDRGGANLARQGEYVGMEVCQACHQEQTAAWRQTSMGRVFLTGPRNELERRACEACHGPGSAHVQSGGDRGRIIRFAANAGLTVEERNQPCLQCHEGGGRLHWGGSMHETRGIACVQCHQVMSAGSPRALLVRPTVAETCYQCHALRRAQSQLSSHMPVREGRLTCTDCHNPHGTAGPSLLVASSVNETCYRCHQERRGPFLWEHAPVNENCLNCHEAHGSMNENLLKMRAPRLCQRCHIEQFHPTTPQAQTSRFAFNRSCTNCHSQIHGSNHPSGVRFHR